MLYGEVVKCERKYRLRGNQYVVGLLLDVYVLYMCRHGYYFTSFVSQ